MMLQRLFIAPQRAQDEDEVKGRGTCHAVKWTRGGPKCAPSWLSHLRFGDGGFLRRDKAGVQPVIRTDSVLPSAIPVSVRVSI